MIEIEKNIPRLKPGKTLETELIKEMILKMDINDSVVISTDSISRFSRSMYAIPKRMKILTRFSYKSLGNSQYRVWRTA